MINKEEYDDMILGMMGHGIPRAEADFILRKVNVSDWAKVEVTCYYCKKPFMVAVSRFCVIPSQVCQECAKEELGK